MAKKFTKKELQSKSTSELLETKRQLQSRPRKMRAGGTIKIGDVVRDMNSTWPKFQCTGVVTSISGDYVTWIDEKTGEIVTDPYYDLEIIS